MITGATAKGFLDLVKDTGILIEDFKAIYDTIEDYDDILEAVVEAMDSPENLGLTRGGAHFISESEMRQIEFDGSRVRFVGDSVKDTVIPRIETTLLQYNLENLKRIMPSSTVTTTGSKTLIRERLSIVPEDYMKTLSWVRERADGAITIFTLYNPINMGSVDSTGVDKSESEIAVTFTGNNSDFSDLANAPYELVIFEKV